jgi:hypothetical protein
MDHQLGYNAYQRSLYAESPSSIAAAIAHPTPHPPVPQFINDPHTLPHGLSTSLPITTNDENNIYALVIDLLDPESREAALLDLSKKREQYDDLALVLWHAFGQPYFPVYNHPRHYQRLTLNCQVSCQLSSRRSCLCTQCFPRRISQHMCRTASAMPSRSSNASHLIPRHDNSS